LSGSVPPYELDRLVGRRLRRPIAFEDFVTFDDVEPAAEPPVRAHRGPGEGARGNREVPPADSPTGAQAAARP
jgi:hypothetical protein